MSERLGRYRLEDVIGVGSFATVHRAVDEALLDTVVIKVLAENHSLNPEVRERFIAEGRSLRKVASPHVVGVHDIGENERNQPYLVLEHADRGTLAARVASLRHQGWLAKPADALAVARQLAAAIAAVHRANLVHRDLSPGNLLLTALPEAEESDEGRGYAGSAVVAADERLVVADLGMCKDLALNSGLTVGGGTAGFRPPEQDGPGMVDTRADLWAMSALLLWLCAGSGPEYGLPEGFFAAVRRSHADDPEDRHPDVSAWLAEIEGALADAGSMAASSASRGRPPTPSGLFPQDGTVLLPEPPVPGGPRTGLAAAPVPGAAVAALPEMRTAILDGPRMPPNDEARGVTSPHSEPAETPRRRAFRRGVIAALALVLAVGVGLAAGWWLGPPGAPSSSGSAAIEITGPSTATVEEPVTFTAETEDVSSWVWSLPTGAFEADAETVTLTATSPGSAVVVLRARAPDGTDLEVRHQFTVQP